VVSNCVVVGNSADRLGGGAFQATLNDCTLTGNSVRGIGGGAASARLNRCTLSGNSAELYGGGASTSTLTDCLLATNRAFGGNPPNACIGGGAYASTLKNCTLIGNLANQGGGAWDSSLDACVVLGNSGNQGGGAKISALTNCTLSNNSAELYGGGVMGGSLANCALRGNTASVGGGAWGANLYNCVLTDNSAAQGGGAYGSGLNNCTLTGNQATNSGGGVLSSDLNNSTVHFNSGPDNPNYDSGSTLAFSCTTPLPTNGVGNITNAPLFVDYARRNLRLQSNSPCINAGHNAYAHGPTDLDGRPRIVAGTVDIGAYEYHSGVSGVFIGWLQQYGLPTDGSADYTDSDGDGHNNWQEWRADTVPTNALSVLRMVTVTSGAPGLQVTWQSVPTRSYWLERATALGSLPFLTLQSNLPGQTGTTTYADTTATNAGPLFYRVGVSR
jgi:hypothetical protein